MVVVRAATLADVAAVGRVHVRSWQAAYRGLMPQGYLDGLDVDQRADYWRRLLSRPHGHPPLLVAVAGEEVVGFASYGPVLDEPRPPTVGELYAINVRPDRWGGGVGRALLTAVHAGLVEAGFRTAVLWVLPGNTRARAVYEHDGWHRDGATRTAEVFDVTVPEIRYRRTLP